MPVASALALVKTPSRGGGLPRRPLRSPLPSPSRSMPDQARTVRHTTRRSARWGCDAWHAAWPGKGTARARGGRRRRGVSCSLARARTGLRDDMTLSVPVPVATSADREKPRHSRPLPHSVLYVLPLGGRGIRVWGFPLSLYSCKIMSACVADH